MPLEFADEDFVSNPAMRCPCLLVLDTSQSMAGDPIAELNTGVGQFLQELRADRRAREAVEVGVITFASEVREVLAFGPVEEAQLPRLQAAGKTQMGAAVRLAIRRLRDRREQYRQAGVSSYVPWLVLMTDGGPNDEWHEAAAECRRLGERQQLVMFGVGIGSECHFETLARFCPADRPPYRLSGYDFPQFFHFMSQSLAEVVVTDDAAAGFVYRAEDDRPADR